MGMFSKDLAMLRALSFGSWIVFALSLGPLCRLRHLPSRYALSQLVEGLWDFWPVLVLQAHPKPCKLLVLLLVISMAANRRWLRALAGFLLKPTTKGFALEDVVAPWIKLNERGTNSAIELLDFLLKFQSLPQVWSIWSIFTTPYAPGHLPYLVFPEITMGVANRGFLRAFAIPKVVCLTAKRPCLPASHPVKMTSPKFFGIRALSFSLLQKIQDCLFAAFNWDFCPIKRGHVQDIFGALESFISHPCCKASERHDAKHDSGKHCHKTKARKGLQLGRLLKHYAIAGSSLSQGSGIVELCINKLLLAVGENRPSAGMSNPLSSSAKRWVPTGGFRISDILCGFPATEQEALMLKCLQVPQLACQPLDSLGVMQAFKSVVSS